MGTVVKVKALAVAVSIGVLALVLGLAQQPAAAQDHDEATRLDQRAIELFQQGRHAEAEPLLKRALEINEKALGPDHSEDFRARHLFTQRLF
jgi:Tfp pilus assembly protein PilF